MTLLAFGAAIVIGIIACGIWAFIEKVLVPRLRRTRETEVLVGQWSVRKRSNWEPNYIAIWTFSPDGTVTVDTTQYLLRGNWKMEPTRVLVTWEGRRPDNGEPCWDSFHRPVKANGVSGDGWDGSNCLHATKLTTA